MVQASFDQFPQLGFEAEATEHDGIVRQCCVCSRFRIAGRWYKDDSGKAAEMYDISHTYCPIDEDAAYQQIREARAAFAADAILRGEL